MVKKVLMSLVVLFLSNNIFAQTTNNQECTLSHKIIYGIAKNERHAKRDVGYPYIISFNNNEDLEMVKDDLKQLNLIILDNRSVDCKSKEICAAVTKYLVENYKIVNLDLGAFQHCYIYYKYPYENYFDLKKSYQKTCEIVEDDIKKYGFTWETIARFHNSKEGLNKIYRDKLQENILKTYPEVASN